MKVMGHWSVKTVDVRADGMGLPSRAGTALLALVADRVGLTGGLSDAFYAKRERRSAHDPGYWPDRNRVVARDRSGRPGAPERGRARFSPP